MATTVTGFRRVPSLFATSVILFIVGIFFFIALLKGQRDLIILSLLVFTMTGGLKLWSRFSPARMRCTLTLEKNRVFAGDTLLLKASAENNKFLPVWLEVEVPVDGSLPCASEREAAYGAGESPVVSDDRLSLGVHSGNERCS